MSPASHAAANWTAPDIEAQLATANALEVAGCVDDGESTVRVFGEQWSGERVDDAPGATFWSVYVWREGQGADCIADRSTRDAARAFAQDLATRHGLDVRDWS